MPSVSEQECGVADFETEGCDSSPRDSLRFAPKSCYLNQDLKLQETVQFVTCRQTRTRHGESQSAEGGTFFQTDVRILYGSNKQRLEPNGWLASSKGWNLVYQPGRKLHSRNVARPVCGYSRPFPFLFSTLQISSRRYRQTQDHQRDYLGRAMQGSMLFEGIRRVKRFQFRFRNGVKMAILCCSPGI
jgi:hypothetical protein